MLISVSIPTMGQYPCHGYRSAGMVFHTHKCKRERMGGVASHRCCCGASEGMVSSSQGIVVIASVLWSGWVRTQEMERVRHRRGQGR